MITLLITVVLGIVFAVFATQNTGPITLNFGNYTIPTPTYLAVLTPLLVGLLLGFFIYIFRSLSQSMTISENKEKIKNLKKEIAEVTKDAHKFEIENSKLKTENGSAEDADAI
jgi:uncharacterized integral membrane protein